MGDETIVCQYFPRISIFFLFSGEGSASTFWDNKLILEDSNTLEEGEIPFVWADVIHRVQPDAKIILIMREPVHR